MTRVTDVQNAVSALISEAKSLQDLISRFERHNKASLHEVTWALAGTNTSTDADIVTNLEDTSSALRQARRDLDDVISECIHYRNNI